jgi:hypothetical protein
MCNRGCKARKNRQQHVSFIETQNIRQLSAVSNKTTYETCHFIYVETFPRLLTWGHPFSWLEKPRNLDCMADVLMGFHRSTFSKPNTEFKSHLAPCDFWAFPTMKREL